MRPSTDRSISLSRAAITALVLAALAATSGCGWFSKNNKLYSKNAESRPLEVPPDLDRPRTDAAMAPPSIATAPAPAAAPAPATAAPAPETTAAPASSTVGSAIGFTAAGSRDEVYAKVDDALAGIAGVEIASRAKLLGAFDVNYQGSNFLVRVSEVEAGAYVSAVDPRGLPATGEAPGELIAALKAAIGGN